jgi:Tol biopolymer transport system component
MRHRSLLLASCLVACGGDPHSPARDAGSEPMLDSAASADAGSTETAYLMPDSHASWHPPSVSGDGQVIAFDLGELRFASYAYDRKLHKLYCMRSDQKDFALSVSAYPQLTRDAKLITFLADAPGKTDPFQLGHWDLAQQKLAHIPFTFQTELMHFVADDTGKHAFGALRGSAQAQYQLVYVDLESGKQTAYDASYSSETAAMSADGATLALQRVSDGDTHFELLSSAGKTLSANLDRDVGGQIENLALSGDGKVFAFSSHDDVLKAGAPGSALHQYLHNRTSKKTVAMPDPYTNGSGTWWSLDHDGSHVAFNAADGKNLMLFDATTAKTELIKLAAKEAGYIKYPTLSADGKVMAFYSLGDLTGTATSSVEYGLYVREQGKPLEFVDVSHVETCQ